MDTTKDTLLISKGLIEMQYSLFTTTQTLEVEKGKTCTKCNEYLPLSSFPYSPDKLYKVRNECKKCRHKLSKEVEELRKIHGMPPEGYKCPICLRNEEEASEGETKRSWVLDHCHDTSTFRGWLCGKCNRDLGNFNNSIDTFKRAIQYLENHLKRTFLV